MTLLTLDVVLSALIVTTLAVGGWAFWIWRLRAADRADRTRDQEKLEQVQAEHVSQLARIERAHHKDLRRAHLPFVRDILPAFDALVDARQSLNKALSKPDARYHHDDIVSALTNIQQGLDMAYHTWKKSFGQRDLHVIDPQSGESFDPQWHQAIDCVPPTTEVLAGQVVLCHRLGLRFQDKTVRPALVTVAEVQAHRQHQSSPLPTSDLQALTDSGSIDLSKPAQATEREEHPVEAEAVRPTVTSASSHLSEHD